jgi:DAACS family dicarboxylate/amino acid:cation (Na+ or H+) symporter
VDEHPPGYQQPSGYNRPRRPLHVRILVGLVVGVVAGIVANLAAAGAPWLAWTTTHVTEPFGRLFLRLIFMVVLPLIFSALALGVAGLGDVGRLGRIGAKTFVYTIFATGLSVVLGLLLVNTVRPGDGLSPETRAVLTAAVARTPPPAVADTAVGLDAIVAVVPDNPLRAAVNGDMLAVMFFSLMVGVGIALAPREQVAPLVAVLEALNTVVMRIIDVAMRLAPYGVAALLFTLTARFGVEVLRQLAAYVAVVLVGLAFHQFVTYSLILKALGGMSPRLFFRRIRAVMVTAFSTSSSNVTLPLALRTTEHDLGVPRDITSFVLTLGSTANQNGTALFEGVTVLFLAQFYGIDLGLRAQLVVVLMAILAGIGTAGVPGGSLPLIVPVLVTVGIPAEGIGVIVGVDRLLDMCRTVLNVTGDIVAAVVVARSEGALDVPVTLPEPVAAD